MITYKVWYKSKFFWHKIKKVKGDFLNKDFAFMGVILEDETLIEIPIQNRVFKFSKERFYSTKERMSNEAGQDIKVAPR